MRGFPEILPFHRSAAAFVIFAAALLLASWLGLPLVFPAPDIEPVQPDAAHPFRTAFIIANPSSFLRMRNVIWYCVMTPLDRDPQIPILDVPQFRKEPRATDISPNASERHACNETAELRREGTYDVLLSLDYETTIKALFLKRVLKRSFVRPRLTWRVAPDGGRWVN